MADRWDAIRAAGAGLMLPALPDLDHVDHATLDLDVVLFTDADDPHLTCRGHNLCPSCRVEVRAEAFAWLRGLAERFDQPLEESFEVRPWEEHILNL